MYVGDWKLENYEQCFELDYDRGSFCERKEKEIDTKLTIFNSTTYASEWLVKRLKKIKTLNKRVLGTQPTKRLRKKEIIPLAVTARQ